MLTSRSLSARSRVLLLASGLLVVVLACGPLAATTPARPAELPGGDPVESPAAIDETPEPGETPAVTGEPPESGGDAAPTAIRTPPPQTGPSEGPPLGQLTAEGPWLLLSLGQGLTATGLWAVNADGSGLTLWNGPNVPAHQLERAVAPDGRRVAYIGSFVDLFTTPNLHLDRLADTVGTLDLPLYGPQSQPGPGDTPGSPRFEAMRAIVEQPNLAWSPDGRLLAFMGAMDGPSSDLYVYSLDTREITRLTDGPSQGFQPVWSPDSRWIVHAGATTFGTGAGYSMAGVWAAAADGSTVKTIYDSEDLASSGNEEFIGWLDDSTFLVHSWDAGCGRRDIRSYDIETEQSAFHWAGYFSEVAYSPTARALLVTVDAVTAGCSQLEVTLPGAGAFLIDPAGSSAVQVVAEATESPVWSDAGAFFALGADSVMQISPAAGGSVSEVPAPVISIPVVSPGGHYWAWASASGAPDGAGLWVGAYGQPPSKIAAVRVDWLTWSPDGQTLLYAVGPALYRALAPDFTPVIAQDALPSGKLISMAWATGFP